MHKNWKLEKNRTKLQIGHKLKIGQKLKNGQTLKIGQKQKMEQKLKIGQKTCRYQYNKNFAKVGLVRKIRKIIIRF